MKKDALYFLPRVLGVLAILFMGLFSADCFGEYDSFGKMITCFVMHNIPGFICLAALVIAWKWELIGGIIFIAFFVAAGIFFDSFTDNPASLIVISPFLLTGALFIVNHIRKSGKRNEIAINEEAGG
jgi:hypothetical protein